MRKRLSQEFHAMYRRNDKFFVCLICEKAGLKQWLYEAWEIPRHLREHHKIYRKNQKIYGWNKVFEKEYLRNRTKPVNYEDYSIEVDKKPKINIEEERKRILEEIKTKRDRW